MNKSQQIFAVIASLLLILAGIVALGQILLNPIIFGFLWSVAGLGLVVEWYVYLNFWMRSDLSIPYVQQLRIVLILVGIGSLVSFVWLSLAYLVYGVALLVIFRSKPENIPPRAIKVWMSFLVLLRLLFSSVSWVFLNLQNTPISESSLMLRLTQNGLVVIVMAIVHHHFRLVGRSYEVRPEEAALYRQAE